MGRIDHNKNSNTFTVWHDDGTKEVFRERMLGSGYVSDKGRTVDETMLSGGYILRDNKGNSETFHENMLSKGYTGSKGTTIRPGFFGGYGTFDSKKDSKSSYSDSHQGSFYTMNSYGGTAGGFQAAGGPGGIGGFGTFEDPYKNVTPEQVAEYQRNQKQKWIEQDRKVIADHAKKVPVVLYVLAVAFAIPAVLTFGIVQGWFEAWNLLRFLNLKALLAVPVGTFLLTAAVLRHNRENPHRSRLFAIRQLQNVLFANGFFFYLSYFADYPIMGSGDWSLIILYGAFMLLTFYSYTVGSFMYSDDFILSILAAVVNCGTFGVNVFVIVRQGGLAYAGYNRWFFWIYAVQLLLAFLGWFLDVFGLNYRVRDAKRNERKRAKERAKEEAKQRQLESEWAKDPRYTTMSFDIKDMPGDPDDPAVFSADRIQQIKTIAEYTASLIDKPSDCYEVDALQAGHHIKHKIDLDGWELARGGYIQEDYRNDAMETFLSVAHNARVYVLRRNGELSVYRIDCDIYLANRPPYHDRPLIIERRPLAFNADTRYLDNRRSTERRRVEDDEEFSIGYDFGQMGELLGPKPGDGILTLLMDLELKYGRKPDEAPKAADANANAAPEADERKQQIRQIKEACKALDLEQPPMDAKALRDAFSAKASLYHEQYGKTPDKEMYESVDAAYEFLNRTFFAR